MMHQQKPMIKEYCQTTLLFFALVAVNPSTYPSAAQADDPDIITLIRVLTGSSAEQRIAIRKLRREWKDAFVPPLTEILRLNRDEDVQIEIVRLLQAKTGKRFGADYQKWHEWSWSQDIEPVEHYAEFKAWLYRNIDPKFEAYFSTHRDTEIRLDEVVWGGVNQDGIPPLRQPKMVAASEADYLEDDHIVFAIEVNGDYRAYPKRIMGWHEMVVDTVGGIDLVGVYCPLCGAMIIYETEHNGAKHRMGTSGFLYRSNKLMFDQDTQSLWNSFWGRPVVGPLVNQNIELTRRSVVTTTWGEWKARHPSTTVLSLGTGFDVNYDEGIAYKNYFSNDKLMFRVPHLDKRLKNKAAILGIRAASSLSTASTLTTSPQPLAITVDFLQRNPMYYDKIGDKPVVVLTDTSGANRVYEGELIFIQWDRNDTLIDREGNTWKVTESALVNQTDISQQVNRVPAHRAFWFGWYSAFTNTRLVYQVDSE